MATQLGAAARIAHECMHWRPQHVNASPWAREKHLFQWFISLQHAKSFVSIEQSLYASLCTIHQDVRWCRLPQLGLPCHKRP
jgi:hypothetical protein